MKLAIDAGHGLGNKTRGKYDPGATVRRDGEVFCEADYNLKYALTLKWFCQEAKIPWFLTRTGTADPCAVGQRARRAKAAGCTHFISFHCNAAKVAASGTETLYRSQEKDFPFAGDMHAAVVHNLELRNRGLKRRDDLAVLEFPGPSALIELGFLAANYDRKRFGARGTRILVCQGIVRVLEGLR